MADFNKIKYFRPGEFSHPEMMDQRLVDKLDLLREACGFPIRINSSWRDVDDNERVGGAEGSQHLQGRAVDVAVEDGRNLFVLVEQALKLGFTGIGIKRKSGEKGFVHLDTRGTGIMMWTY